MVIDEFAARFVYFYTGYLLAPRIFALAAGVQASPEAAFAGLTAWGLLNGLLVFNGLAELPFVSLGLGLLGATAVVSVSALMAKSDLFKPLRYCGQNSIVIYLAFFLPMAASRIAAHQDRLDRRHRHHLGDRDARRRDRPAGAVLDGASHPVPLPVRAAAAVLADAEVAPHAAAGRIARISRDEMPWRVAKRAPEC